MRRLLRAKIYFSLFILLFLCQGVLEKLEVIKYKTFYPFYHWELGFGRIRTPELIANVYISEVNGAPLSQPMRARKWAISRGKDWISTDDYKSARQLYDSYNQKDYESFTRYQKTFCFQG